MNGPEEPGFLPSKLSPPRPQTVGKEVREEFHDDLSSFPEHYKSSLKEMEHMSEDLKADEPENCEQRNTSPPAPFKWAQSLQCLLEDAQGVALFEQFLKQEGHDTRSLSFWFACRGVKKTDPNDAERLHKLIHVLYDKKVRRIAAISNVTKAEIHRRLSSGAVVDVNIFDDAQREVEQYMLKTTYPNFLNSDLYIQHLGTVQNEPVVESPLVAEAVDFLPTVHEDSELNISVNKVHHMKEAYMNRRKIVMSKTKPENQAGSCLKSPYGTNYSCYHTKYAPFLPASAQDSELQSLSSDAQTDDTMSQADSSVDFPMRSRKQKCHPKTRYYVNIIKDRIPVNNFIPRTQLILGESSKVPKDPEKFHEVLVKKLCRVLEEQKTKDKINERLKSIESHETSKSDGFPKNVPKLDSSNQSQVFLNLCGPSEDNVQDILDKHVSRVFDDTGLTPTMSPPVCASPPVAKRPAEECARLGFPPEVMHQDLSYTTSQRLPNAVPYNVRCKRDHDTRSSDSGALTDWISEDNLPACHRMMDASGSQDASDYNRVRSREQLRRHISKKLSSMTDSSSSCVDSGISVACEPSHSKVTHWLETKRCTSEYEKEHIWKTSSTSPVLSRSSSTRKAVIYNSTRSGALDAGSSPWQLVPSQPLAQDLTLPPPDTTTNLIEARRRLEDESRSKMGKCKYMSGGRSSHDNLRGKVSSRACDSIEDGISHRKQSKKSNTMDSSASSVTANDVTVIGYSYGRGSVPYKSRLPGKNITLRQFKSLLNKKGNFRYFFKRVSDDFGTGVVLEEVIDDYEILPLWEGKVFCVIETMEDCAPPPPLNED